MLHTRALTRWCVRERTAASVRDSGGLTVYIVGILTAVSIRVSRDALSASGTPVSLDEWPGSVGVTLATVRYRYIYIRRACVLHAAVVGP